MAPDAPAVVRGATPVVEISGLTKRLGSVLAVDGLDLRVDAGQVVGLAGPNGAGKSVTLKILLGLVRPSAGRVALFGEPVRAGSQVLGRVGALVDGPGFIPHLSGLENLRLAWRMTRRPEGDADLERAVAISGLGGAIDRHYRTYSHGMRYRLGLAQALLGRPELLILDEPTTGLDPAHIREIRLAIAAAAAHGATILLSSHLLSEVEHVCTHAAVMRHGRLIAAGPVTELVGVTDCVRLDVDRPAEARQALVGEAGVSAVELDGCSVIVDGRALRPADLFVTLTAASVEVRGFRRGRSLEEAYLALIEGDTGVGKGATK
jgi:ABC-2 type transport system ATP-binding protein